MATRQQALATAAKYGMVLDERHTGKIGNHGQITFDHPTHCFGAGECRSITVGGYTSMATLWSEAIERMNEECPHMEKCTDPNCDYHGDEAE